MRTLTVPASFEVNIKRSRFIAHASRVDSQADTLEFYESVADPTATHNCWAWRLDYQYRFNDDGEPASTAGRPILSAIEGKGLDNVMVVVIRYFGGIKLGVGGLIRAYSGSTSKCLDQANIIEIQPKKRTAAPEAPSPRHNPWRGRSSGALVNACLRVSRIAGEKRYRCPAYRSPIPLPPVGNRPAAVNLGQPHSA